MSSYRYLVESEKVENYLGMGSLVVIHSGLRKCLLSPASFTLYAMSDCLRNYEI